MEKHVKKLEKQILSILLCLCMVCTLLPTTALAAEAEHPHSSHICENCTHIDADPHRTIQAGDWNAWTDELAAVQNGEGKTAANSLPKDGGNYYLTEDVTLDGEWELANDTVLCLNGYTITIGAVIQLNNISLTITDCGSTGKLTRQDGGVCVYIIGGSTFNMYGGVVTGFKNGVDVRSGTFNMYGGTISNNSDCGVIVSGTFDMYGGTISGNHDVGVHVSGTFNMHDGSITGNTGKMGHNGGGVYVSGTFNMSGGSITGNNVDGTYSSSQGGGVYVDGTMTVSGNVTISGNVKGGTLSGSSYTGGTANNVYLPEGKTITVSGVLNEAASIGVTTETEPVMGTPVTIATGSNVNENCFASDKSGFGIEQQGEGESAVLQLVTQHVHSFTYSGNGDTITANCDGSGDCDFSGNKTLTLVAPTLTRYGGAGNANATFADSKTSMAGQDVMPVIQYQKKLDEDTYDNATETAPTTPDTYKASIAIDGATASVEYTIAKQLNYTTLGDVAISDITSKSFKVAVAENDKNRTLEYTINGLDYEDAVLENGSFTVTVDDNRIGSHIILNIREKATELIEASYDVTSTVKLLAITYSIALSQSGTYNFPEVTEGYEAQTPLTVTVSNTGTGATDELEVTITGSNADSFTLSKNSITDIAVSSNDTFTIVPKTDLSAGTYTATVTVSGGNGITGSFDVSFTVNEVPLTYSIALSQSGTYNFPEVTEGYEALTPLTVTVTNTGTADTGVLKVYLTGNNTQFDLVATDVIGGIAPNETKTFTVVPKTGIAASDVAYTAYVTVMNGDKGIEAGFTVKFIVNADGGSTPAPHSHSGGTATCKDEAVCTGCGQPYGSKDSNNHTGGTEVRGKVDATTTTEGYTGDTYCLGCNTKIATGTTIPKKDSDETSGNTDGGDSGNDGNGVDTPPVPDDEDISPAYVTYTVQSGDTLWAIAKKYSCTVSEIVAANSDLIKNPDLIHVGWQIKIPQAGATGADTDTPDAILPDDKKTTVYIVKQGDSLWAISKKYGCTIAEIVALNGELIIDPDLIYAGWELKILQD